MTDLQKQTDQDVGNYAERERVTYLTLIQRGKDLRDEELRNSGAPVWTDAAFQDMQKQERALTGQKVMTKVYDILNVTGSKQVEVEKAQAREIDAILAKHPEAAEALAAVKAVIDAKTQEHKTIIVDERNVQLAAIEALYK